MWFYLKYPNDEHGDANGTHDVSVIIQKGFSASFHPDIKFFCHNIITVVSSVVCELVLDTWSGRVWIATTEGDSIHQEFPINITF